MNKACDLLLSDRDYRGEDDNDGDDETEQAAGSSEKSDLQQLKDLYQQCSKACAVIEKEGVSLPIVMPLVHGHQPVQRPGMVPSSRAPANTKPPAPKNIIPNRRLARIPPAKTKSGIAMAGGAAALGSVSMKRGSMERHKSVDLSSSNQQPFFDGNSAKRQRTGSMVQQPFRANDATDASSTVDSSSNPPPAAKQFLAKLNRDKAAVAGAQKTKAETAGAPGLSSTDSSSSTASKSSSSTSSSPSKETASASSPAPPTRTQPSRTSRNRS